MESHQINIDDLKGSTFTCNIASQSGKINKLLNIEVTIENDLNEASYKVYDNKEVVYDGLYLDKAIEIYNSIGSTPKVAYIDDYTYPQPSDELMELIVTKASVIEDIGIKTHNLRVSDVSEEDMLGIPTLPTLPPLETLVETFSVFDENNRNCIKALLSDRDHPCLKNIIPKPKLSWYGESGQWLGTVDEVKEWRYIK